MKHVTKYLSALFCLALSGAAMAADSMPLSQRVGWSDPGAWVPRACVVGDTTSECNVGPASANGTMYYNDALSWPSPINEGQAQADASAAVGGVGGLVYETPSPSTYDDWDQLNIEQDDSLESHWPSTGSKSWGYFTRFNCLVGEWLPAYVDDGNGEPVTTANVMGSIFSCFVVEARVDVNAFMGWMGDYDMTTAQKQAGVARLYAWIFATVAGLPAQSSTSATCDVNTDTTGAKSCFTSTLTVNAPCTSKYIDVWTLPSKYVYYQSAEDWSYETGTALIGDNVCE